MPSGQSVKYSFFPQLLHFAHWRSAMSFIQAFASLRQQQQFADQAVAAQPTEQDKTVSTLDSAELALIGGGGAHGGNAL